MSLLQAILMGIIQGATEFLPVSSSGHLAIFKNIFGVETDTGILFDILLHFGTLVAIFIVYWADIKKLVIEGLKIVGDCCVNLVNFIKNIRIGRLCVRHTESLLCSYSCQLLRRR